MNARRREASRRAPSQGRAATARMVDHAPMLNQSQVLNLFLRTMEHRADCEMLADLADEGFPVSCLADALAARAESDWQFARRGQGRERPHPSDAWQDPAAYITRWWPLAPELPVVREAFTHLVREGATMIPPRARIMALTVMDDLPSDVQERASHAFAHIAIEADVAASSIEQSVAAASPRTRQAVAQRILARIAGIEDEPGTGVAAWFIAAGTSTGVAVGCILDAIEEQAAITDNPANQDLARQMADHLGALGRTHPHVRDITIARGTDLLTRGGSWQTAIGAHLLTACAPETT